jgi:hypothetical protein
MKSAVAGTENEDIEYTFSPGSVNGINGVSRLTRFNGNYMMAVYDDDGQYFCEFKENDDTLYGLRRGLYWIEDSSTANLGSQSKSLDVLVSGGIAYYANIISSTVTDAGFVVHALGHMSSLPENTQYSCAYFGVFAKPNQNYGYTENTTGSPTVSATDDGLDIDASSGEAAYYNRTDVPPSPATDLDDGFKCRFVMKPVTDGGISSDTAQGVGFKLQTTAAANAAEFYVSISTAGVRLYDINGSSGYNYTSTISDYKQFLVAYQPTAADSAVVKVYMADYGSVHDEWTQVHSETLTIVSDSNSYLRFGTLGTTVSGNSNAIWKAVYYADKTDNNDIAFDIEDGMAQYNPSSDSDSLVMKAMEPHEIQQEIVGDILLTWSGLDAYSDDRWTFTVDSQFSANNILTKSPWYVWRSEADSAASGTSTAQYIQLDADLDDLGMFVFDTAVLMHYNGRYVTIQANDDGTSWSPSPLSLTLNLDLDSGTISTTTSRTDDDMLVIVDTTKSWIVGEFQDQYVMLEYIFEEGDGSTDNYYRNVAFRILDNGTDHLVISTKGLTVDELNTSGTKLAMSAVSGTDYVIYGTRKALPWGAAQTYRYVRITIPASAAYGTAWADTNQPSLPNERCWRLGEFDLGTRVRLRDNPEYGYTEVVDPNRRVDRSPDGKLVAVQHGREYLKFKIGFDLADDYDHDHLEALYHSINETAEPFWYIPDIDNDTTTLYLVQSVNDLRSSRMLPEYQEDDIDLEEVT